MASSFIPSLHFAPPSKKMNKSWAKEVLTYYYYNSHNMNLLHGKNVAEIDGYASGDFDMRPFLKMFKSLKKDLVKHGKIDNTREFLKQMDVGSKMGFEAEPLALLPEKLNSAIAVTTKVPIEIVVNATDPLAIEKKQKDINFIKNKPLAEAKIQEVADRLGLPPVDLGTTENSSVEFSESPFGLDLTEPDELDIFVNLIYSLKIESSFETALQAIYNLKNRKQTRTLEVRDQFRYGVSCNRAYQSDITGFPECDYVHPSEVEVPFSLLPDYSDRTHEIETKVVSALDLMNYFGSEIKNKEELEEIINGKETGYCDCNGMRRVHYNDFKTMRVTLKRISVRTVDYIGVAKSKSKKGYTTLTEREEDIDYKIWGQNTYSFWWLYNTDHVFGIEKLGFAHREPGKESVQNFPLNIYRSQEKSAIELSIGENKKAQIADMKMQHTIIMSLPPGRMIDIRGMRNAAAGLAEGVSPETVMELINLSLEKNLMIVDTQGFEGKNDGQFKPVIELMGGLALQSIAGYMNVISMANQNISRITGINQQLTGQKVEELIGLQQIAIDSGINALYYTQEAIMAQDQKVFNHWANIIKQAIEEGGKPKEAIKALIGSRKVSVIDGLDDIAVHDIGITIKTSQRQQERQFFLSQLGRLEQKGVLSASDVFMVTNIDNPKDQYAFLAVKEQKWNMQQAIIRQQEFAQQQQLKQQEGQNGIAREQAAGEEERKTVYTKAETQARILELASQLGLNAVQIDGLIKKDLQQERNREQRNKGIELLREKSNLQQQEALI